MKDGFITIRESKEAVQVAFSVGVMVCALAIALVNLWLAYIGVPL